MSNSTVTNKINNVSDTAFWVATYRAQESSRPDALFKDPYAALLAAEKGQEIVDQATDSKFVSWTIVIRTCVIDEIIQSALLENVDTVINLGAGLDTRPYRMDLPSSLNWVEVDYPSIIHFKEKKLNHEKPKCHLERVALDLADRNTRQKFFSEINSRSKKTLVLTEGVIPYLSEEQVGTLAIDLHAQSNFRFWVTEYHSHEIYRHLQTRKKVKEMENSPFQFFPQYWLRFFNEKSWKERKVIFLGEEAKKLGRPFPLPWWAKILQPIMPPKARTRFSQMSGFILFESK